MATVSYQNNTEYNHCHFKQEFSSELVSKELKHLAAILHLYARGVDFYELNKKIWLFSKRKGKYVLLHF